MVLSYVDLIFFSYKIAFFSVQTIKSSKQNLYKHSIYIRSDYIISFGEIWDFHSVKFKNQKENDFYHKRGQCKLPLCLRCPFCSPIHQTKHIPVYDDIICRVRLNSVKWSRRESNPRPKYLSSSFYKLSHSFLIPQTVPPDGRVAASVAPNTPIC